MIEPIVRGAVKGLLSLRYRIRLIGAEERWQDITDSAYFYLHSSIHASNPCSVAPFGLGHRHYFGGVLWDTDIFMYPTVLLTAPKAARNLKSVLNGGLKNYPAQEW